MEFTRYVYALYAEGDKTVRYIGQAGDLQKRLKQHTGPDAKFPCIKSYWITGCKLSGRDIKIRKLETVSAATLQECKAASNKREWDWIRASRERGIRLVNGKMWLECDAPKYAVLTWEYMHRLWFDAVRQCKPSELKHLSFWKEHEIVSLIEASFPELCLDNSNYKRMYKLPLSA